MTSSARPRVLPISVGPLARATPLELFFDLVFVFAFTQVTGLMTADPTWAGMTDRSFVFGDCSRRVIMILLSCA